MLLPQKYNQNNMSMNENVFPKPKERGKEMLILADYPN